MNRGNCRKLTPIPKYEWCVIDIESKEILAKYITKGSAVKEAKKFNDLEPDSVRVEKIKNPCFDTYWNS